MKKINLLISFTCILAILFAGETKAQYTLVNIPNASFEKFSTDGIPTGWNTLANPMYFPLIPLPKYFSKVEKETNGYIGNAVKLQTTILDTKAIKTLFPSILPAGVPDTIVMPGLVSLGQIDIMGLMALLPSLGNLSGNINIDSLTKLEGPFLKLLQNGYKLNNLEPATISGYYKSTPKVATDAPMALAITTHYNTETQSKEIVSFAMSADISGTTPNVVFAPTTTYAPFSFDFLTVRPDVAMDTLYIFFLSSANLLAPAQDIAGSLFWVDEVSVATKALSNDTTIKSLFISAGNLDSIFRQTTKNYTISVPYDSTKITIIATPTNGAATIENAASLVNVPLKVGDTTLSIKVIAEDGVSTGTYTFKVIRNEQGKNTDATLKTLKVSAGDLTPGFTKGNKVYFDTVYRNVDKITLTVAASDEKASIEQINLSDIPLAIGDTTISITVTAEDGVTKATYTITITRLPSLSIGSPINTSGVQVSIYPNPATDVVNIKVNGNGIVEIFNFAGQKVFTKAIANYLSVDHLVKGVYFVRVTTGQGTRTEKLIVK